LEFVEDAESGGIPLLPNELMVLLLLTGLLPKRSNAPPELAGLEPTLLKVLLVFTAGRTEAIVGL
jgi:hypothetical protein